MLNVKLAGGHLYGKQLFTWLSLVMSLMVSFCAVLFPTNVLDEIWDLIESVSEGFLIYSCFMKIRHLSFSCSDLHKKCNLIYVLKIAKKRILLENVQSTKF